MADFDSEHIYIQWGGKLPGGEQWSCGIRLQQNTVLGGGLAVSAGAAIMTDVAAAVQAFHTSGNTNLGTAAKLSYVKSNVIAVNGRYKDPDNSNEHTFADLPGGGTIPQSFPNQVALAVTLTTAATRGPAHKGRFYLPCFNSTLDANGLVPAANVQLVSQAVDTFIAALHVGNGAYAPAVFSRKPGAATHKAITGNLVGRVLDTQRRRRRSLVEDYQ